jgi:hypothetical protein
MSGFLPLPPEYLRRTTAEILGLALVAHGHTTKKVNRNFIVKW